MKGTVVVVVGVVSHHLSVGIPLIGRSCPSVVVELGTEEIVEGHADGGLVDAELLQRTGVGEVEVGGEVLLQLRRLPTVVPLFVLALQVLEARVGQVLVADVLADDAATEALVGEGEDVVQQHFWRESQGLVAKIYLCRLLVVERHRDVLHAVA